MYSTDDVHSYSTLNYNYDDTCMYTFEHAYKLYSTDKSASWSKFHDPVTYPVLSKSMVSDLKHRVLHECAANLMSNQHECFVSIYSHANTLFHIMNISQWLKQSKLMDSA